jgi:hypothetical protein
MPIWGQTPTTLASGQPQPYDLAVDSTNAYWVNGGTAANNYQDGSVMKVSLASGTITTLASGQNFPQSIAIDATTVYWANIGTSQNSYADGTVMKVPIATGTPTTIASQQTYPGGVSVNATRAFWGSYATNGAILYAALDGGTPTTLVSGQGHPERTTLDGNNVYWVNRDNPPGTVMSAPLDGGTPATIASGQNIAVGILVNSTSVFWTTLNDFYNGVSDGTVMMAPILGGASTTIASGEYGPSGLAADSTSLYWTVNGTVMKVALDAYTSDAGACGVLPENWEQDCVRYYTDWGTTGACYSCVQSGAGAVNPTPGGCGYSSPGCNLGAGASSCEKQCSGTPEVACQCIGACFLSQGCRCAPTFDDYYLCDAVPCESQCP